MAGKKAIGRMFHSLTARLVLGVLALGLALGALLFTVLLHFIVEDYQAQFINSVRSQSYVLAGMIGAEMDEPDKLKSEMEELLLSGQMLSADLVVEGGPAPAETGEFKEDFFFGEHGDNIYNISIPVTDRKGAARGVLNLRFDESYTRERIDRAHRRALYLAVAYTGLLLLLAALLGATVGRPLRRLRMLSREIASGRFDRPLTVDSRLDEVANLSEDLEAMRRELIHRGREIAVREERHRAVLEHAAEGIITLDSQGRIESFNAAAEDIFGHADSEVIGTPFTRFLTAADAGRVVNPQGEPIAVSGISLTAQHKNGESVPILFSATSFLHDEEKLFSVVVQDISERVHFEEKLARLAYYDPLTGLPNRRLFHDRLSQALVRAERNEKLVGLLFFDLDRFKEINDTLGHLFGDLLLQGAAKRLTEVVRKDDTVARLGGDEFTVILTDISNVEDVSQVAQKVIELFSRPFQLGEQEVFVSTSIGVTIYPFDDSDIENLIKNADTAMYKAKALGRNRCQFYAAQMHVDSEERLLLETALRKSLQEEEMQVYFQPQVHLHYQAQYHRFSGHIVGAEALARWQHPKLGMLYPERFIGLAEETGLIVPVGERLLRAACVQSVEWRKKGLPPLRVAVNISPRQLQHPGIAEQIGRILAETGMEPAALELELTESLILHNTKEIKSVLAELKGMGVMISIDDFGTGHSSLANLQLLPIDTVKIDKSFVRNVTTDMHSAAIATAVIEMAHQMGIRVVAEGVEMEDQLVYLHSHRCDIMQGYYFSRPLPAADFEALLRRDVEAQNPLRLNRSAS